MFMLFLRKTAAGYALAAALSVMMCQCTVFAQEKQVKETVVDLVVEAQGDGEAWNYRTQLFGDTAGVEGRLTLRRQNDNAELKRESLKGFASGRPLIGKIDLKSYGKGAYELEVIAVRGGTTVGSRKEILYFLDTPWKNIDLDKCEVVAPWTPVEVTGKSVKCWGREYAYGDGAFPESMKSQGNELLAGPVAVAAWVKGKKVEWKLEPAAVTRKNEGAAEVKGAGKSRAGNLSIRQKATVEYDGLAMIDLSLDGKDLANVTKLEITIPVKGEMVRYVYRTGLDRVWVCGKTGIRTEPGVMVSADFMPFAWLGNDDEGLFWFCDSNRAWPHSLAGSADAIQIVDTGSEVVLQLRIVAEGEKLEAPWKLRFGLMATPVKPGGNGSPKRPRGWGPSGTAGKTLNAIGTAPGYFKDYSIPNPVDHERVKKFVNDSVAKGYIPMPFTMIALPAWYPEWKVYGSRWHQDGQMDHYYGEAIAFHPEPDVEGAGMACCFWTDFNKWFTWRQDTLLKESGWRGYYRDGVFNSSCASRLHGHGRNGAYDYQMEPLRKHYRYLYTEIKKLYGDNGWVFWHTSGLLPLPLLAYADSIVIGEDLNGVNRFNGDYRKILALDELRNQYMGKAWGYTCTWLSMLRGEFNTVKNTRTLLALQLLHDIGSWTSGQEAQVTRRIESITAQKFGFSDSEYFPYFRDSTPAKVLGKDLRVSLYKKPDGRTMAVVANLSDKNLQTTVTFDPKGLGLSAIKRCADLEHDFNYQVKDNSVRVIVRAADFRLLVVE